MNIQNYNFVYLNRNQRGMGQSLERISSGARINRAADDAAGLAISSRFSAEYTSLLQASKNINIHEQPKNETSDTCYCPNSFRRECLLQKTRPPT